jgi:hypothetical protein
MASLIRLLSPLRYTGQADSREYRTSPNTDLSGTAFRPDQALVPVARSGGPGLQLVEVTL